MLVDKLLQNEVFSYIDYAFAERLLRDVVSPPQSWTLFLCFLFRASREGNLCIEVTDTSISPDLWAEEEPEMRALLLEAAATLPSTMFGEGKPICRFQNRFYLQRHWQYEKIVSEFWEERQTAIPALQGDSERALQRLEEWVGKKRLLKEQAAAIQKVLESSVTIITGGPGSGKTYTAAHLIDLFWHDYLSSEARDKCVIGVAAPTGKATAHLLANLTKIVTTKEALAAISAKTLHSFLKRSGWEPLDVDLLIVDESSMMDAQLMARLLSSLKEGSRLVLLGDPAQLPPIEAGNLFGDLCLAKSSFVISLTTSMRTDLKGITHFSHLIGKGESKAALQFLQESDGQGLSRFFLEEKKEILAFADSRFPFALNGEEPLEAMERFRFLCPLKKGKWGGESLNGWLCDYFYEKSLGYAAFGAPILITVNDYSLDLYNGETGLLIRPHNKDSPFALFPQRGQKGTRRFFERQLPPYEWAYCLSVHKSQGSEFDEVFLFLPEGSQRFGREMLYTAATRAKQSLLICGSDEVICETIERSNVRISGLLNLAGDAGS